MIDSERAGLSQIEAALSELNVEDAAHLTPALDFEGALRERLQYTSVELYAVDGDGMIRVPAVLFCGDANKVSTLLPFCFSLEYLGHIDAQGLIILTLSNRGFQGSSLLQLLHLNLRLPARYHLRQHRWNHQQCLPCRRR